jgi:hypothetical protein
MKPNLVLNQIDSKFDVKMIKTEGFKRSKESVLKSD